MVQNIFGLFPSEEIFEHVRPDEEITLGIGVAFRKGAAGEIGIAHAVLRQFKVAHADARLMLKGDAAHLKARLPVRLRTEALVRGKPRGHHNDEIERQLADGGADIVDVFAVYGRTTPKSAIFINFPVWSAFFKQNALRFVYHFSDVSTMKA